MPKTLHPSFVTMLTTPNTRLVLILVILTLISAARMETGDIILPPVAGIQNGSAVQRDIPKIFMEIAVFQ
jgi:hypothetical protein